MAFDFHHFNPSHLLECRNLGAADGVGRKHDYVADVLSAHETGEVETLIPIYAHKRHGYFWKVIENRVRFRMCSIQSRSKSKPIIADFVVRE